MRSTFLQFLFACFIAVSGVAAQSTSQSFPTPITTSEIKGQIKARDIGDGRVTTYFYSFSATQGDMFVNIVASNLNGSFDIFTADELQPLTKILVYADESNTETGRVVYLRKPEKLILRIEGRTPNDDPANFALKFAGAFVAAAETDNAEPELPEVKTKETRTKVNSVGTVIERIPKKKKAAETVEPPADSKVETTEESEPKETPSPEPEKKVEVVVSDNVTKTETVLPKKPSAKRTSKKETRAAEPSNEEAAAEKPTASSDTNIPTLVKPKPKTKRQAAVPAKEKTPDPLTNIHLTIEMKDGRKIEVPMNEVLRFTVDRGVLTVVKNDGSISRYQITDVQKTTIE